MSEQVQAVLRLLTESGDMTPYAKMKVEQALGEEDTSKPATNVEVIAQALVEYGECFRGDWSSATIDGRTVRVEMAGLSAALVGITPITIEWCREWLGMCPNGKGHWTDHCDPMDPDYCGAEET